MSRTRNASAKWTTLYQMINQTNLAIKRGNPNISMPDARHRNDYLGQAYALRAFGYFYAIRVWGDVPLLRTYWKYSRLSIRRNVQIKIIFWEICYSSRTEKAESLINRNKNYERKAIFLYLWRARAIMRDAYMYWKVSHNLNGLCIIDKTATIVSKGWIAERLRTQHCYLAYHVYGRTQQ